MVRMMATTMVGVEVVVVVAVVMVVVRAAAVHLATCRRRTMRLLC